MASYRDSRRTLRRLVPLRLSQGATSETGGRVALRRLRLRTNTWRRSLLLAIVVVSVLLAFIVVPIVRMFGLPHWQFVVGATAVWAVLVAGAFLLFEMQFSYDRLTLLRDLSAIRLCFACGYDLTDSPVEKDGCTVCAECGAAWRLERISGQ